jgi:hypothetical protein
MNPKTSKMAEHLLNKHKALSSTPQYWKKKNPQKSKKITWKPSASQWFTPVILATWETEIGGDHGLRP